VADPAQQVAKIVAEFTQVRAALQEQSGGSA
jgi:hypothetical protein